MYNIYSYEKRLNESLSQKKNEEMMERYKLIKQSKINLNLLKCPK